MQEISRAILLPPPASPPQRSHARVVQGDAGNTADAARGPRRQAQAAPQSGAFLALVDSRRDDTVEIKGKQFRFRPYGARGSAAEGSAREAGLGEEAGGSTTISTDADEATIAVEILDGFGAGARQRNSSAFIASFIAQERLRQGLHNPPFEAASGAYRRAGGSPSAPDNQARVISFAV